MPKVWLHEGQYISRESWKEVTQEDKDGNIITYTSRIACCDSCLQEREQVGYYQDYCCCVHNEFNSKKEENAWVKKSGFWKEKNNECS